jgi:hypothetical protein
MKGRTESLLSGRAGFIKSTLHDMFKYLEANMGLIDTPLKSAMDLTNQPVMHQGSMGDQGLAWYIRELDDGQTVNYTGGIRRAIPPIWDSINPT